MQRRCLVFALTAGCWVCGCAQPGGGATVDGGSKDAVTRMDGDGASGGAACPATAFDASPATGNTCNVSSVLATDGMAAGLINGSMPGTLAGQSVTGCVGVDFGAGHSVIPVTVRAEAAGSACGVSCSCGFCGTGDVMLVFSGTTMGSYAYVKTIALTASFADYDVTLAAPARFVVVCRSGAGFARDNVEVDSIHGSGAVCIPRPDA